MKEEEKIRQLEKDLADKEYDIQKGAGTDGRDLENP